MTATLTIRDMSTRTGVVVVTGHDLDFDIPVLTGIQRQGDVIVVPRAVTATSDVPPAGTPVVRGEAGGNTHAIYPDGPGVRCEVLPPSTGTTLTVARLVVDEGSVAYLGHPEHAFAGIGAGSYEIRRQREQADEIRMVAD